MTQPLPTKDMIQRKKKMMPKKWPMSGLTGGNWAQCGWMMVITSSVATIVSHTSVVTFDLCL